MPYSKRGPMDICRQCSIMYCSVLSATHMYYVHIHACILAVNVTKYCDYVVYATGCMPCS